MQIEVPSTESSFAATHAGIPSANLAATSQATDFLRRRPLPPRHVAPKAFTHSLSIALDLSALPSLPPSPDIAGPDLATWHAWALRDIAQMQVTQLIRKSLFDAGAPHAVKLASESWMRMLKVEAERCVETYISRGGIEGPALLAAIEAAAK